MVLENRPMQVKTTLFNCISLLPSSPVHVVHVYKTQCSSRANQYYIRLYKTIATVFSIRMHRPFKRRPFKSNAALWMEEKKQTKSPIVKLQGTQTSVTMLPSAQKQKYRKQMFPIPRKCWHIKKKIEQKKPFSLS